MVYIPWKSGVIPTLTALYLISISPVLGVLQSLYIDDHDYTRIAYSPLYAWYHDPLIGYQGLFSNGTRSYTYVPGASASLSFTGYGIFLAGPGANDQALRRVILDGQDMGVASSSYSTNWTSGSYFWSKVGLTNGPHTVVVIHNDTTTKILVMDYWMVQFVSDSTCVPTGTLASSSSSATHVSATPRSFRYSNSMAMIISIVMLLLPVDGL